MKLLVALIFFTISGFSQDTITSFQAKDFIGKEIFLKGKIASFKMASEGKTNNYINIDKAYPNNIFTIVIPNKALETLGFKIEESKDKVIIVKGKIEVYEKDPNQTPQIYNPKFIKLR